MNQTPSLTDFAVLEAYQRKNRKTRAPDPLFLRRTTHYRSSSQDSGHAARNLNDSEPVGDDDNDNDDGVEDDGTPPAGTRATRHSKTDKAEGPKPTHMGYYSGAWVDILEEAKNLYRLHVHTTDPFPERDTRTLQHAHDCLLEAFAAYEVSPGASYVDTGKYNAILYRCATPSFAQLSRNIQQICNVGSCKYNYAIVILSRHAYIYSADFRGWCDVPRTNEKNSQ